MLSITDITYTIGARTILEDCNINIVDGWKVGVIGINGAGKSTLFKLISDELTPDRGDIKISARQRLGQVRQDIKECDTPLIDMVLEADEEMSALMKATETETDPNKIADIYMRLTELDAYSAPSRAAILLTGLGFKEHELRQPFSSFSGGWRMRVALAAALFVQPEILLLDEPTNHLDLEAIMWLEGYLANYPHTLLIISHDREILNKCIDHVVHIDQQTMTLYTGNYDTFERERAAKRGLQQKMHVKQQAQRDHMQAFVDRFKAQATKAKQAQSRIKALERMDIVDAVIADRAVQFSFPESKVIAPPLISIRDVSVGYTEGEPILEHIFESIDTTARIGLLGANGNGKSTMMKLIAGKLEAMSGEMSRSGKLKIGYFSQHQTEELDVDETPVQSLSRMLREKTGEAPESKIRAKLGQFGFSRDLADNKIGQLSGGEKARLLFAFMSYDAPHMLLLDEPTNHLDVDAREALVQALNNYNGAIIMVSHDPGMVERVADQLWLIKDGRCNVFNGDIQEYRKFVVKARNEERKKATKPKPIEDETTVKPTKSPSTLKRELEKAEKSIATLTSKKETLETALADPEIYNNVEKMKDTQNTYNTVSKDLEVQEEVWINTQAALEEAS